MGLSLGLLLATGCGDQGEPVMPAQPPHTTCTIEAGPSIETAKLQAIHDASRLAGQRAGRSRAKAYVDQRTNDGYRLRRFVTLALMGIGLLLVGGLVGTLLLSFFARRPTLRYANVQGERTERELSVIRGLAAVVAEPLAPILVTLERKGQRMVDECKPLQEGCDTVSEERRLETLYSDLDSHLTSVERLRIEATTWAEQIERGGAEERHARAAMTRRLGAFAAPPGGPS
jgi:hypothetical protein